MISEKEVEGFPVKGVGRRHLEMVGQVLSRKEREGGTWIWVDTGAGGI